MLPTLITAANDHLMMCLENLSEAYWRALAERLLGVHGFTREGRAITGHDERIYPDFRRADCRIAAGYDNWLGNYLLSSSDVADEFLRGLQQELSLAVPSSPFCRQETS